MKLRTKILVGFMSIIVLMGILGGITYTNFLEINKQFEFLIEHDLEVLQNAQQLQKFIVDAETGQRGFIIVGEESFLEPYYSGISGFSELVKIEKHLVSDDPSQMKKLEEIEILFNEWKEKAAIPEIELARKFHTNDINFSIIENQLKTNVGKNILDNIRIEFDEFIIIENELKNKRFERVQEIKSLTQINIGIFVSIASILGISIAMILSQSINKSLKLLMLGTTRFGKGEFEPIPITGKDEISDLSESFNEMAQSIKFSNKKLQEMNTELKKTEILKEEFVAMISHELKTPLTPILMWAGALQDKKLMGELNDKQTKATKTILNCATELAELISDIFDSYKLDLEKIEFSKQEINLMELMDSVKETAEKLIGEHKILVENTTNENVTVYSDKKRVDQIFKNLITNAIDFVDQDSGKIEINASVKGENVEFMVKDNGVGIKKEFQEELFKKFYQIDASATRKHGGSGLGLSICQGMINGMKGKIWVESEGGDGTTFYFTLPIVNKTTK